MTGIPLLIGEIFIDVTITPPGVENKMRLGGIAHAARAFWASGLPYAVAAFLPDYLEESAREYLNSFGCSTFVKLGSVIGAPNVILIFDAAEVDDQGYETLLRDEKRVEPSRSRTTIDYSAFDRALIFPGGYELKSVVSLLPERTKIILDIAYDVDSIDSLNELNRRIDTVILSTSSDLFRRHFAGDFEAFAKKFSAVSPEALILKENRGGCRAYFFASHSTINVPAYLGETVNSVGVGDAFCAAYVSYIETSRVAAVWRGAQTASCYAQTTEPDLFRAYVKRELALSIEELAALPGAVLPWEERPKYPIYLAAPDFSHSDRGPIDASLSALGYHNFNVRRPVLENGELPPNSGWSALNSTYHQDVHLLKSCDLVFAVPGDRDAGTLVEIGLAIAENIPVVVYDPLGLCSNTMVIAGAFHYSKSLDECLNAVFYALTRKRG